MTITSMERSPIEAWLSEKFVKFEYAERLLTDFDEAASLKNQARFEALKKENVIRYAEAMQRGSVFPAVVAWLMASGKLLIIDGNHRYAAAKTAGRKTIPVYILNNDTAPETIQVMTFEANPRLNGEPPSTEERLRHGIWLIDNGATREIAASVVGVTTSHMTGAYARERADRRATSTGVKKVWAKLSPDARAKVQTIKSDPPFIATVNFVAEAGLTNPQVKELVQGIQSCNTDAEKMQFVEEQVEVLRQDIQQRAAGVFAGKKKESDDRRALVMHLGAIRKLDPQNVANGCITLEQKNSMFTWIFEVMSTCEQILDILGPQMENNSGATV